MYEVLERAGGFVLGSEGGELRKLLVHYAKRRREIIAVDVVGEEAADVPWVVAMNVSVWALPMSSASARLRATLFPSHCDRLAEQHSDISHETTYLGLQ